MFSLFKKKNSPGETAKAEAKQVLEVATAMSGAVIDLADVPDPVFSGKMVGEGFAIEPVSGEVVAPVSGELVQLFPTRHAFGIKTDEGLEVLVHVGIDTVQLKGEGFESFVQVGERVVKGQRVLMVDLEVLKAAGKSTITPVIITNMTEVKSLTLTALGQFQTAPAAALSVEMK